MFRLDGKIAMVTGAASGIGQAIATVFAGQGATVVIADLNLEAAQAAAKAIGDNATAIVLNVSDEAQVQAAFEQVNQQFGRIDVVVNNAGISHVGNILETSLADWERVMSVNARGVFLGSKYAVQAMLNQNPAGGNVINIASIAGMVGLERRCAYGSSKGAVISLTRSIAIDYATKNIRANAICPGTVLTPFVEGYLERDFADRKDEVRQQLHARQPIGRMGLPDEIANAALYLAADESSFVTGSAFVIDGGLTAR